MGLQLVRKGDFWGSWLRMDGRLEYQECSFSHGKYKMYSRHPVGGIK